MNRQFALFCAWFIAFAALVITLYSSIIMKIPACNLCWYQRICIYPLVIILGIGAYQDDLRSITYAMPLTVIGAFIALYQYLIQWFPSLESIGVCGPTVSCSDVHMRIWGFITYPLVSLMASLVIIALLLLAKYSK